MQKTHANMNAHTHARARMRSRIETHLISLVFLRKGRDNTKKPKKDSNEHLNKALHVDLKVRSTFICEHVDGRLEVKNHSEAFRRE